MDHLKTGQATLESYLVESSEIIHAKIINVAEAGDEPSWIAALVVAKGLDVEDSQASLIVKKARKYLLKKLTKLHGEAGKTLMPKKWVILDTIPTTSYGDINEDALRRQLTRAGSPLEGLSSREKRQRVAEEQLSRQTTSDCSEDERPTLETELVLSFLWGQILRIQPQTIRRTDSFLRLGGDSITAVELCSLAESFGITLTAALIMQNPQLHLMAVAATLDDSNNVNEPEPFSLLSTATIDLVKQEIRESCGLSNDQTIQDVYPCTTLQEGFMALALKQPGSYITRQVYRLPENVDTVRFKAAWERTVEMCSCLRSRIALVGNSVVQALVSNDVIWEDTNETTDIRSFIDEVRTIEMSYQTRLCRYGLIRQRDGTSYFVWIIHHAVFDGLTARIILDTLHRVYHGLEPGPLRPYSSFIQYTRSLDVEATKAYWQDELRGAKQALFPRASHRLSQPSASSGRVLKKTFPFRTNLQLSVSQATIIRAAWALLLGRYCDTDDVCFGTTVSGRQAPVAGASHMPGPMIATVPIRTHLDRGKRISEFLQDIQARASAMVIHEQYGLQNIAKLGDDARDACDFSNLLVIQPEKHLNSMFQGSKQELLLQGSAEQALSAEAMENYFNYPLVMQVRLSEEHIELDATYDSARLEEAEIDALFYQLNHILQQLLVPGEALVQSISVSGPWDIEQSQLLNQDQPQIRETCIHHLIEEQAQLRPDDMAVCAWDYKLTYRDLNQAANRLASYLVKQHGIKTEDLVHVCFNKSAWYFVAILAINKAGAAWVPLDPSHPVQRLQQIMSQTRGQLTLISPENTEIFSSMGSNVLEVSSDLDRTLKDSDLGLYGPESSVSHTNAAYVLFTSGSTGTPKGFVMEHGAVATSQTAIASRLGLTPVVRMLQFAAFAFDLSIGEIIAPLISGACVCIPSDETRMNNLANFISDTEVNWAFLTPSFARTLKPEEVPGLKLLLLAGEAVSRDILDVWFGKVRLINGWGPAETCVFSTLHEWKSVDESPLTIGRPVGGCCWVVDPNDPQHLAPIGTLGEVVIQGPTLLREYLDDPERTAATSVTNLPDWAPRSDKQYWNRFYKSGDLCSYNADGTLEFSSRKDTQVKIRGLRVELGEIEYHIRNSLPGARQVAVDVMNSDTGSSLVSYICFSDQYQTAANVDKTSTEHMFLPMSSDMKTQFSEMAGRLSVVLPTYMLPSLYIPCRYMPFIASTKLDMKLLRQTVSELNEVDLRMYSLVDDVKRPPETESEFIMQTLWSNLLQLPKESIGRDDSFLRLGGDSIAAIYLVSAARDAGISLTVKDIFDDPRLFQVAGKITRVQNNSPRMNQVKPFSLISEKLRHFIQSDSARKQFGLLSGQVIEDAYPCTPLQEGLMALTAKQPGSYISKYFYRLGGSVDVTSFKFAWEKSVELFAPLRARILLDGGQAIQYIVSRDVAWENTQGQSLTSFQKTIPQMKIGYGTRLSRFALVEDGDQIWFAWIIHHAVNDGWSMRIVLDTVSNLYAAVSNLSPYANFIHYLQNDVNNEAAREFWQSRLQGAHRTSFPPTQAQSTSDEALVRVVDREISFASAADASITMATILRAAWAIVLGRYSDSNDVCYGATISGRQAPLAGLLNTPGAVIATVPVRVQLDARQTVLELLQGLQSHALETIPYEQYGLANISKLSPDCKEACDFNSLLVIQPKEQESKIFNTTNGIFALSGNEDDLIKDAMNNYFNYPLVMLGYMSEDAVKQRFLYDPAVLSEGQVQALSHQFDFVVQQLLKNHNQMLSEISVASEWDRQHAINSSKLQPATEACVHWSITDQIEKRLDGPAIASWDGDLTYRELGMLTSRLASNLQELGVEPEVLVPFCFDKSIWAIVTMVAIEMAGGALVPLDPAAPVARLRSIIEDTNAKLIMCSPSHAEKLKEIGVSLFVVSEATVHEFPVTSLVQSSVKPQNTCVVLFTSGSTGKPKGMMIPHSSICSSSDAYGDKMNIGPDTRVFQFSAYTFDVGILDVLVTLMRGGCICVPSEHDRINNLASVINDLNANWVFLTPTVADMLDPAAVPHLKTICLGGEAITKKSADRWKGYSSIHGLYGPAEASICAWNSQILTSDSSTNLGVPLSSAFWVVEPNNPERLAPVGCIGELIIQGPMLARGYLNVDEKTAANWMEDMQCSWLPQDASSRAYRTGDLVRHNADGTYEYIGRKDNQIKIRGQRVELSEIEHCIASSLPSAQQVMVDICKRANTITLVAYICFSDHTKLSADAEGDLSDIFVSQTTQLRDTFSILTSQLTILLPQHMVPTLFIICLYMPLNSSAKLNRKMLASALTGLSETQLSAFTLSGSNEYRAPETEMEASLQNVWAKTLDISVESIGRDSNFLRLGGDSITAIYSVMAAAEIGISFSVKDIFDDPRLWKVATKATHTTVNTLQTVTEPFSLVSTDSKQWATSEDVRKACRLTTDHIVEDAYPCTSFQEGLMTMAIKQPGSYIAKHIYQIPEHVDTQRLADAWEQTIQAYSVLRTRIILEGSSSMQIVLKDDISWDNTENLTLSSYLELIQRTEMKYESRLCRYGLIEEMSGVRYFVWTIHHALFDGWTMQIILKSLQQLYYNQSLSSSRNYSEFVKYTNTIDAGAAGEYWSTQLKNAQRAAFPPSASSESANVTRIVRKKIQLPNISNISITKPSLLRASWAIVLARYSEMTDICFGVTISGRQAPVPGIADIAGPTVSTVPVRVNLDKSQPVVDFLQNIQSQASEMVTYEQFGLQNIAKLGSTEKDVCDFSSLLVIQPGHILQVPDNDSKAILMSSSLSSTMDDEELIQNYFSYPLVVQGVIHADCVEILLIYNSTLLSEGKMVALSHHFEHVSQQLASASESTLALGEISVAGPWDMDQCIQANSEEPEIIESCIHELIEAQTAKRPMAPAINAWDGTFSYSELDQAANRLAHHLVNDHKVLPGDLVHVCFERTIWYFVAIFAINKAGGAWVPLDPSHPSKRKQQIVSQTHAKLALVCSNNTSKCDDLGVQILEVSPSLDEELANKGIPSEKGPQVKISPNNTAYVLFTSGSTGTPKGVVIEHRSVCTSQTALSKRLSLTPDVRLLQFASFVFDFSIGEIMSALISGACLYVPSEHTRMNDLAKYICEMDINWAFLTPAFARTLKPTDIPCLELLLVGGEASSRDLFTTWFGHVRLIHAWGPTETCVISTLHEWKSASESNLTIGSPVGGFCWIVNPEDATKIAPIGTLGELVVQGPTLLREYLSDPKRTKDAVVEHLPEWAPYRDQRHWSRFYKSGDLCYYNADGTIEFSTRKDTQVKIRGLRVELGEVEHQLRHCIPSLQHVVVDVFTSDTGPNLAAYICFNRETRALGVDENNIFLPLGDVRELVVNAVGQLAGLLPDYMIPTLFFPCAFMPIVTSTKLDRRSLNSLASALDQSQLVTYSPVSEGHIREPITPMERRLRRIWAEMLNLPISSIGRDSNFLRIGGDSIAAIHLGTISREDGILITVKDVFDDPRLLAVAAKAVSLDVERQAEASIPPFGLLTSEVRAYANSSDIKSAWDITAQQTVEDAYPCTHFQEGLMALSTKQPGSYMAKYVYRLSKRVKVSQFKEAWETTLQRCPVLQTRIILVDGQAVQIIVNNSISWDEIESKGLQASIKHMQALEMTYGSSLCRYSLIEDEENHYFLWTIHHAIHDGWTVRLVLNQLNSLYRGVKSEPLGSYSKFIKYCSDADTHDSFQYWKKQLRNAQKASFPPVPANPSKSAKVTRIVKKKISFSAYKDTSITRATILRAAWAMVLAHYCDSEDITFGTTVSGRQASVPGLETMAGPMITTVPVRVRFSKQQNLPKFLQSIQTQANEMVPFEQFGLQNITKISPSIKEACDFSSLLLVQPMQYFGSGGVDGDDILVYHNTDGYEEEMMQNYFSYPLVIQGFLYTEEVELLLIYDSSILADKQVEALSHYLEHVIEQLMGQEKPSIGEISLASSWDIQQVVEWNKEDTEIVDACVHQLIERQAMIQPDALAIQAWDGELTYHQLNSAANRLAHHLHELYKIKPDDLIHVCIEKSLWYIVAILAINKAGAGWVPLEPSHPIQRMQNIVEQTGSKLILTSASHASTCRVLVPNVIEVGCILDEMLQTNPDTTTSLRGPKSTVKSSNIAHVLFTSGSTGVPKGLVLEHRAVCTSQTAIFKSLGMTPDVKMLHFASCVFDLSIGEIIGPLVSGACICIPSEEVRLNSISNYIQEMQITWALLTPSFARTMNPKTVPNLQLLILAGEPLGRDVFEMWFSDNLRLVNGWGPAETCVFSSLHEFKSLDESPLTIGRPIGGFCWIMNPENTNELAPVGTLGEVIVQGPTLLREYLSNPERTKDAIINQLPTWTPRRSVAHWNRAYKTGDLGSYNPDGTILYAGRKDTQVKIRGLRIELGEVEHHIKTLLPGVRQVAVDVFHNEGGSTLATFICFNDDASADVEQADAMDIFLEISTELQQQLKATLGHLAMLLPSYMVPTLFFPCQYMPLITSTKLDRKTLKNLAASLDHEKLSAYALNETDIRAPETPMEIRLQALWSRLLNIPANSIGRDSNFLRIGGDSIACIHLVTMARENGISLLVKDIFDDPRLLAVAEKAVDDVGPSDFDEIIEPFSLLPDPSQEAAIGDAAREQYALSSGSSELNDLIVEDAYPCTPFQEGLMTLSVKHPGSYIAKYAYRIPQYVDIARFKDAWEQTLVLCPNLRTRIILLDDICLQTVVTNDNIWASAQNNGLSSTIIASRSLEMTYGSPLCQFTLVEEEDKYYFVLSMHHAIFDGWSNRVIFDTLDSLYNHQEAVHPQSYNRFIKYASEIDKEASADYWRNQLQDAKQAAFPEASKSRNSNRSGVTKVLEKLIEVPPIKDTSITKATIFRAAWALVLARYSDTDDICFGTTVSGRQAPVHGVTEMPGPMVATIPVRVKLDKTQDIPAYLQSIQKQASEMVAHEQYGLQNIGKLGEDIKEACDFTSLLIIQPLEQLFHQNDDELLVPLDHDSEKNELVQNYFTYPLVVQGHISQDLIKLVLIYDSDILPQAKMEALSHHFDHVMQQLSQQETMSLDAQAISSSYDVETSISFNAEIPEIIDSCIHTLVERQVTLRPDAPAICAWDREFTYDQLDKAANRLAHYLIENGAKAGDLIHVCFEKTAWFFVAILAVNKSGGTWSPLDPSHPEERLRQIISQTKAKMALASSKHAAMIPDLVDIVIEVSVDLDEQLFEADSSSIAPVCKISPRDAAYVLFTSGSTGVPKGFVMEHKSVCTSQTAIAKRLGFTSDVRMLQFAAFVFDLSIGEIIATLISGGCICVPSEEQRSQGIADFINTMQINCAFLTPSFIRTLSPDEIPSVELIVLAGEAVPKDVFETWCGAVRLVNGWGPAETCCFSTLHEWQSIEESSLTIGKPVGGFCWIVDAENPHRLAPIGTAGEIVIQGPTLLREYLDDQEKTRSSIISPLPEWAPRPDPDSWNRLYKTGDLGFYNPDGTIQYLSRRDTQVKIRGLRIELAEIEHQIMRDSSVNMVVVDVLQRASGPLLCAFVLFNDTQTNADTSLNSCLLESSDNMRERFSEIASHLSSQLPSYMVPEYYIPVRNLLYNTSGKLDRKSLLNQTTDIPLDKLKTYSIGQSSPFRSCTSDLEIWIRAQWAQIFSLPAEEISTEENFYHLGGDSIKIVTLSKAVRTKFNVKLGASILNSKRTTIRTIAKHIEEIQAGVSQESNGMNLMAKITTVADETWAQNPQNLRTSPLTTLPLLATVFLTGATGYLGTEILRQLVRSQSIGRVITLVRASSDTEGFDRIKRTASITGWWRDDDQDKIEVWLGDLAKSRLGLDASQWARLGGRSRSATNIDAFVHNGAVVNWHADYDKLASANIDSATALARLASTSPVHAKLVFVSGGAPSDPRNDQSVNARHLAAGSGYVQTKFVAEGIIHKITERLPIEQNRISSVKPGRIIGASDNPVANTDDFIWRIVATAAGIQAYPLESEQDWVTIGDVSAVGATILGQIFATGPVEPFIHIQSGVPVPEFWEIVNSELEIPCRGVSWDEWIKLAVESMEAIGDTHPLWPVQSFLGRLGWSDPSIPEANDLQSREIVKEAVKRNVQYLTRIGFISSSPGSRPDNVSDQAIKRIHR